MLNKLSSLTLSRMLIAALLLTACGGASPQAVATIGASLDPATIAPEPTLTQAERETFGVVAQRARSMSVAATDLIALGGELRATVEWKTRVRTAAHVITGGQKTIAAVALPAYYRPLAERIQAAATNCAKPAESLLALDIAQLAPTAIDGQRADLERWCVTELDRVRLAIESL